MKPTILIVDDEESVRESLKLILEGDYHLVFAVDAKSTLETLKSKAFDLCLLDILLPDGTGTDLLRQIKRRDDSLEAIMVTALQSVDTALEAMKLGACDYVTKPFQVKELLEKIKAALSKRNLKKGFRFLKDENERLIPASLTGKSKAIQGVHARIKELAQTGEAVLIRGEAGTGKADVAWEIHRQSPRQKGPFVTIACGTLSKSQLSLELYGREEKDEITKQDQIGKLEFAEHGTLYLEDVDKLSLETQDELAKIFLERKIQWGKKQKAISLDFRLIASSGKDLIPEVDNRKFRGAFYQLLSSQTLLVPSLRDRREDIPGLIRHFLEAANQKANTPVQGIHQDAIQLFMEYGWPGNLWELESSVETMVLFAGKENLDVEDVPLAILSKKIETAKAKAQTKVSLRKLRHQFERQYIRKVLERTRGNQTRTAATLGLHRNTLIWKLKELDLEEDYKKIVKKRREGGVGFRDL